MTIEPERLADIMAAGGATMAECAVVLEWHRLSVLTTKLTTVQKISHNTILVKDAGALSGVYKRGGKA